MFSETSDFVISYKLLMSFPLAVLNGDLSFSNNRKKLPEPRFNLGDWVWTEFTVEDDLDSNDGKTYKLVGYVIGVIYHNPESNLRLDKCDYVYHVQMTHEDGVKVSSRFPAEIPDYELYLLT